MKIKECEVCDGTGKISTHMTQQVCCQEYINGYFCCGMPIMEAREPYYEPCDYCEHTGIIIED